MAGGKLLRSVIWLVPLKIGIGFIGGGVYMISQGLAAKKQVRDALAAEQVLAAEDTGLGRVPVIDVKTAEAQAEVIRLHSLHETEGRTFAQIPRGDPLRDYYLHGVTLRTALGLAVMGMRVSDLVVGMGAFMASVGGALILIAPSLRAKREDGASK